VRGFTISTNHGTLLLAVSFFVMRKLSKEQRFELATKTVVITGATSGAGRATALEFARHGAKIVVAGRREEALIEVVDLCREMGGIAIGVPTDVTDPEAMVNLAATANEFGGSIDVWVNNAGVLAAGEFTETPVEVHDRVIEINLMGYIHGAHAVLPYFKRQNHGILINNISVGGWFPVPYGVGYSASKYGLRGFSEALRGELSRYRHIHICDVFPAFLDTPGIQHAANYTGKILQPAPPVYDPQKVARAIVRAAKYPKDSVVIGAVTQLLRLANAVLPKLTRTITAKVIETYLKKAEPAEHTTGNLFQPSEFGTSIHGGWSLQLKPNDKKLMAGAFLASLAAGFFIIRNKNIGL
jgi:short-subunit dehydrogenase